MIAYGELRDGKWEVFVASFPAFHDITQVSQAGGVQPRWRGDGRELFFLDSEGAMMSVTVDRGSPPKVSVQHKLFDTGLVPDPDGQSVCSHSRWSEVSGARAAARAFWNRTLSFLTGLRF